MNILLHSAVGIVLAVLPWTTEPQGLVPVQFQTSPVQVASGSNAIFTLQTITDTFSISWSSPDGKTLGEWIGSQAILNPVPQYQGRISISATQLKISTCLLTDAGNYTATVTPSATTGLTSSSRSVALNVFDAVTQVSLFVPSVAIEGGNVTLRCNWATGSSTSVAWSKGGSSISSTPHITINAGSLILDPASRSDAGLYSCTVSNPVSAQTATATLTVYYGPDTPAVTKTSSECVGGGDATVGQTVQLTCTSVSLPPALLSWQYGGKPLTTSQPNGGTLSLQVFSTNQSGQYICTARNSVTGGSSQQQLSVSVVGTCLSPGAVAGIVVGCFVALVLIIVAIVLLLRQRKVDRRLRDVIGVQKTNLDNVPPVLLAPPNRLATSGMHGNGDQPDPPLHSRNRQNLQVDHQTSTTVWRTGQENNEVLRQDRLHTSRYNGHPNTGTSPNNNHHNSTALPYNSVPIAHGNSNSFPHNGQHNSSSFPQSGRENPEILIQTGHPEAGAHTVLINLNSRAPGLQRSSGVQPRTVQVNLTAPHPSPGLPNPNITQDNQQSHMPQQAYPNVQTRTENPANAAQRSSDRDGNQEPSGLVRTDRSYPTNQGFPSHITAPVYPQSEHPHRHQNRRRSRSSDPMPGSNTHLRQMPWDRLRGTPAYPNAQVNESDSSEYHSPTMQDRSPRSDPQRMQSPQTPTWRSPESRHMQTASQVASGHLQRQEAQHHSRTDQQIAQRQSTQPNGNSHVRADRQNPTTLAHPGTHNITVPQNHPTPTRTSQPTHKTGQTRPDERQAIPSTVNIPHPVPLTQAALELNTSQTANPFTSRNPQTQATLQTHHPRHAHPNSQGVRPPTPPPVLRPAEFHMLPRNSPKQSHMAQPARRPGMHTHTREQQSRPQRRARNQRVHASTNPPHINQQFHRSRPRL